MVTAKDKLKQLYDRYARDPVFEHLRLPDANFVPGSGVLNPTAMLIGEAPGAVENARIIPFVGPAGVQLNKLLIRSNIDISNLYFTNVLKYWPRTESRKTRPPSDEEIQNAKRYLLEEIEIVNPGYVGLCGRIPTKTIFPNIASIRQINGQLFQDEYIVLYHPAVVLYKPDKFDEVLQGYRELAKLIDSLMEPVNG